jgi:hypothetical protein
VLFLIAGLAAACGAPAPGPTLENVGRAEAAVSAALGEARSATLPLRVRVLGARQVASSTLQVDLEIVRGAEGEPPADPQALATAVTALTGMSVLTGDGRRRLFPLQGERPALPPTLPAPGASQRFRLHFASDTPLEGPVTVLLPGMAPIAGVPVS